MKKACKTVCVFLFLVLILGADSITNTFGPLGFLAFGFFVLGSAAICNSMEV